MDTHTHQRMQSARMSWISFRLQINPLTYLGDCCTPTYLMKPLDIIKIGIVCPLRLSCVVQTLYAFHVCTCQCIRFEYLTLKMKVKDVTVEDFDENCHAKVPCQHAYVCKN